MHRPTFPPLDAPIHLLTTLFCVVACIVVAPSTRAQSPDEALAAGGAAQAIVSAINQARAESGLPSLQVNALLSQAAQAHADDIFTNYNYGHWGTDGSTVYQRVARTGYSSAPWVSENWVSSTSPGGAMAWWMSDYIHRANILNGNWAELGVGVAAREGETIFVTVFSGGRDNGEQLLTAAAAGVTVEARMTTRPTEVPYEGLDYTVLPGDTLSAVAQRYAMDWTLVAQANGLTDTTLLQIGQVIHLPGAGEAVGMGPGMRGATTDASAPVNPGEPYIVRSGDTLFSIAAGRGITWQDLAAFNRFAESDILQIGAVIRIPTPAGAEVELVPAPVAVAPVEHVPLGYHPTLDPGVLVEEYYSVQAGDTIFSIAMRNGLDWQALLATNGLSESSLLQPGQRIRLRW